MRRKAIVQMAVLATVVLALMAAGPAKNAITKKKGATIVNTTTIMKKVKGLNGPTPVKIYIVKGKVDKVETLANQETPGFFERAVEVLNVFKGKTVDEAATMKVDAVSGATYSSEALIQNVQGGLKYYQQNK